MFDCAELSTHNIGFVTYPEQAELGGATGNWSRPEGPKPAIIASIMHALGCKVLNGFKQ